MNKLAEMWGYEQAAEFLHVSVVHTRKMVMIGRVPCYRPFGKGGRVLFDPDELRAFVAASRIGPHMEEGI